MNPQTIHALRQYAIMLGLAVLGFFVEHQTGVMNTIGIPEVFQPVVIAGLASAQRLVEGLLDANRAREGIVVPSDVGYDRLAEEAADPYNFEVRAIPESNNLRITPTP